MSGSKGLLMTVLSIDCWWRCCRVVLPMFGVVDASGFGITCQHVSRDVAQGGTRMEVMTAAMRVDPLDDVSRPHPCSPSRLWMADRFDISAITSHQSQRRRAKRVSLSLACCVCPMCKNFHTLSEPPAVTALFSLSSAHSPTSSNSPLCTQTVQRTTHTTPQRTQTYLPCPRKQRSGLQSPKRRVSHLPLASALISLPTNHQLSHTHTLSLLPSPSPSLPHSAPTLEAEANVAGSFPALS